MLKSAVSILISVFFLITPMIVMADDSAGNNWLKDSINVGDKAPDFTLPDYKGGVVKLSHELKNGPVVLTFYRGSWCPICNIQLHGYQARIDDIKKYGAQIIAVSPEVPTDQELTLVKDKITFPALSDKSNSVAAEYGIVWEVPEDDREGFDGWIKGSTGKSLADFNQMDGYGLPVPATFVIAKDGTVAYAFKEVDYRERADIDDILKALEAL